MPEDHNAKVPHGLPFGTGTPTSAIHDVPAPLRDSLDPPYQPHEHEYDINQASSSVLNMHDHSESNGYLNNIRSSAVSHAQQDMDVQLTPIDPLEDFNTNSRGQVHLAPPRNGSPHSDMSLYNPLIPMVESPVMLSRATFDGPVRSYFSSWSSSDSSYSSFSESISSQHCTTANLPMVAVPASASRLTDEETSLDGKQSLDKGLDAGESVSVPAQPSYSEAQVLPPPCGKDVEEALYAEWRPSVAEQETKDYHEILGLSRTATFNAIKLAFRKLALEHHPDRVKQSERPAAEERFKEISEAMRVLSNLKDCCKHYEDNVMSLSQGVLLAPTTR